MEINQTIDNNTINRIKGLLNKGLSQGDFMRIFPFINCYAQYEQICFCGDYLTLDKLNDILEKY